MMTWKDYDERRKEYPVCNLCGVEIDEQESAICQACSIPIGLGE